MRNNARRANVVERLASTDAAAQAAEAALTLKGITKAFPGIVANDGVSLDLRRGEIHALIGENGAGKSTLVGILAGMLQPDAGSIEIGGTAARLASPADALKRGIGTVYQHGRLVPSLSVIENLMLGGRWWRTLDRRAARARFDALSRELAIDVDPDAEVGRLALGQQQQVEIMRALWHGGHVLVLDEPTSMLPPDGVEELAALLRRLRAQGRAILFITHKIGEATALADRFTVLRRGKVAGTLAAGDADPEATIVGLMFGGAASGADIVDADRPGIDRTGTPRLELRGAATRALPGERAISGIDLSVWPGEVLGIAGVDGNGQRHLAEVLAGQRPLASGTMRLDGRDVSGDGVAGLRRAGVRYVTDARLEEGVAPGHDVATNLFAKAIGAAPHWRHGLTRWSSILSDAATRIAAHDIQTRSPRTPIDHLSGGNIQRVLLARELASDADGAARLIVFNKPTHGLDLRSTSATRQAIRARRGMGDAAIVLISNELDELLGTCDRIAVLERGRVRGVVDNMAGADRAAVETEIGRLMTGLAANALGDAA